MLVTSRALFRRQTGGMALLQHRLLASPAPPASVNHFATAKKESLRREEDRARGESVADGEFGSGGLETLLQSTIFLIGCGAVAGLTAFVVLSPSSVTKTGKAVRKRDREERTNIERREGDQEEEETSKMRLLELQQMEDAKREHSNKAQVRN